MVPTCLSSQVAPCEQCSDSWSSSPKVRCTCHPGTAQNPAPWANKTGKMLGFCWDGEINPDKTSYKVGIYCLGTIPRVPPFSLWNTQLCVKLYIYIYTHISIIRLCSVTFCRFGIFSVVWLWLFSLNGPHSSQHHEPSQEQDSVHRMTLDQARFQVYITSQWLGSLPFWYPEAPT